MKVAIMQPYIFPYLGYFHLVDAVDTFVFYDDVNFVKKGFINRNRILLNNQAHTFSIPCKSISQNKRINKTFLNFDLPERKKLIHTLEHAYKKAPFYGEIMNTIEPLLMDTNQQTIADIASESIKLISEYLKLETAFQYSSVEYSDTVNLNRTERLIEISNQVGAKTYVNAIGGKDLYTKQEFEDKGLQLKFVNSNLRPYKQFENEFVSSLSIIDVLMFNDTDTILQMLEDFTLE
ncbi:WbqC family protein [Winogradskyella sp. 3972H.M.0a.05]|uniref:WbqC family protein n=1 Tax=Winogradskyella sp. 3972H.M.0a.05 TaxID=2950277 RepID=UPI0033926DC5